MLFRSPHWSTKPFVAPSDIHWVKVDRISGKRVFGGAPTSDPKSSIIWEAFKAESEARTGFSTDEIEGQRDALINAIKRGATSRSQAARASTGASDAAVPEAAPSNPPDAAVPGQ